MPKSDKAPETALIEEVAQRVVAHEEAPRDQDGVPYCKLHHCRMIASGSPKGKTYYRCQVPDCKQTAVNLRVKTVPNKPQECARCSRHDAKRTPVYCERDTKLSDAVSIVLRCPVCGWKSPRLAVPQIGAIHTAMQRRANVADYGER